MTVPDARCVIPAFCLRLMAAEGEPGIFGREKGFYGFGHLVRADELSSCTRTPSFSYFAPPPLFFLLRLHLIFLRLFFSYSLSCLVLLLFFLFLFFILSSYLLFLLVFLSSCRLILFLSYFLSSFLSSLLLSFHLSSFSLHVSVMGETRLFRRPSPPLPFASCIMHMHHMQRNSRHPSWNRVFLVIALLSTVPFTEILH